MNPSQNLDIGCISIDQANNIRDTQGYMTKIAGKFDEDECLKRAASLGALCNYDSAQPCQYIARTTSLNSGDKGDCWIIGHGGKPMEFAKMIYKEKKDCPTSGDLTKSLKITTTNSSQYQEDQKKLANDQLKSLKKDIGDKEREMSKTQLYIKCLHTGGDYQSCLQDQAKTDVILQEEEEKKGVLKVGQKFQQVRDDYQKGESLLKQFEKRGEEMQENLGETKGKLNKMSANINLKNQLIDFNNSTYNRNEDMVFYLRIVIFSLVLLFVGIILYHNMERIMGAVQNMGDTITNMGNNMGMNLGLGDNFGNIKLRNLKNFSF